MQARIGDVVAVRQEILDLLNQQMEALDSPLGLTDAKLKECYDRQARVQELREWLQMTVEPKTNVCSASNEPSTVGSPNNVARV